MFDPIFLIGTSLAVLGIVISTYYGRKALLAERQLRTIGWPILEQGVHHLWMKLRGYNPEVIISVSAPGSLISSYLLSKYDMFSHAIIINSVKSGRPDRFAKYIDYEAHFVKLKTPTWEFYVPRYLSELKDRKIFIVEDVVISGQTYLAIKNHLLGLGFLEKNIHFFCLFATRIAIDSGVEPNYFWRELDNTSYYLPWGKITGRTF